MEASAPQRVKSLLAPQKLAEMRWAGQGVASARRPGRSGARSKRAASCLSAQPDDIVAASKLCVRRPHAALRTVASPWYCHSVRTAGAP
ncbi:hypothetical protein PSPO01_01513 [Paraphaeosphaeria sporulosa]